MPVARRSKRPANKCLGGLGTNLLARLYDNLNEFVALNFVWNFTSFEDGRTEIEDFTIAYAPQRFDTAISATRASLAAAPFCASVRFGSEVPW